MSINISEDLVDIRKNVLDLIQSIISLQDRVADVDRKIFEIERILGNHEHESDDTFSEEEMDILQTFIYEDRIIRRQS